MLNEDDTRVKLVDPKLHDSGWREEKIVRRLDKIQEKAMQLKKHQQAAQEKIEAITQAILKKAFNGEL